MKDSIKDIYTHLSKEDNCVSVRTRFNDPISQTPALWIYITNKKQPYTKGITLWLKP